MRAPRAGAAGGRQSHAYQCRQRYISCVLDSVSRCQQLFRSALGNGEPVMWTERMCVTWMLHVMEAAGTFRDEPSTSFKDTKAPASTNLEILSVPLARWSPVVPYFLRQLTHAKTHPRSILEGGASPERAWIYSLFLDMRAAYEHIRARIGASRWCVDALSCPEQVGIWAGADPWRVWGGGTLCRQAGRSSRKT